MKKETALVTGASSGIGLELARVLAREKHDLVIVARSTDRLNELKAGLEKEYSVSVQVIGADLSEVENCDKLYEEIQKRKISVGILVNNAGFGDFGKFNESDWDKDRQMIELNVMALTRLTHLFLPGMLENKGGRILNVASTAAFQPGPLMAVYFATKAYVLSFSEAVANELNGTGVTVTALCPGPTESGFGKAASLEDSKLLKDRKLPTSKVVAEYGYKAMMSGRTVAIHGVLNRVLAATVRFVPRKLVTGAVRRIQDSH